MEMSCSCNDVHAGFGAGLGHKCTPVLGSSATIVDAAKLAATSWFLHRAKRLKTTGWN